MAWWQHYSSGWRRGWSVARARVRRTATAAWPIALALVLSGCGPRVVIVDGTREMVMRAGPDLSGHVYVLENGGWTLSRNRMRVPEGYLIVTPSPDAGD